MVIFAFQFEESSAALMYIFVALSAAFQIVPINMQLSYYM